MLDGNFCLVGHFQRIAQAVGTCVFEKFFDSDFESASGTIFEVNFVGPLPYYFDKSAAANPGEGVFGGMAFVEELEEFGGGHFFFTGASVFDGDGDKVVFFAHESDADFATWRGSVFDGVIAKFVDDGLKAESPLFWEVGGVLDHVKREITNARHKVGICR